MVCFEADVVEQMDIGVGSFVFSQGVVSAIPIVKNPSYLNAPVPQKVLSIAKKCLPLLLLGVVRVITVKAAGYPVSPVPRDITSGLIQM